MSSFTASFRQTSGQRRWQIFGDPETEGSEAVRHIRCTGANMSSISSHFQFRTYIDNLDNFFGLVPPAKHTD